MAWARLQGPSQSARALNNGLCSQSARTSLCCLWGRFPEQTHGCRGLGQDDSESLPVDVAIVKKSQFPPPGGLQIRRERGLMEGGLEASGTMACIRGSFSSGRDELGAVA